MFAPDKKFDTGRARDMAKSFNQQTLVLACDELDQCYRRIDELTQQLAGKQIKRCPFCGGHAYMTRVNEHGDYSGNTTDNYISCNSCCIQTDHYVKPEDAILAWNSRVE